MHNKSNEIYADVGCGTLLSTMARQSMFWFIRADAVDQWKLRVQHMRSTNSYVHHYMCRGLGAKGFACHLAVADANMKKCQQ